MDQPASRKRRDFIRRPKALPPDDAKELARCEKVLISGTKDFIEIGSALASIQEGNLFRGEHPSFPVYCEQKWALARRTVYQKLDVYRAYTNIQEAFTGDDDDLLPTNEFQLRQLLPLRKPSLRVEAWRRAVKLWMNSGNRGGRLTAEFVKTAVKLVRAERVEILNDYIIADTTFTGVPHRLDVYLKQPDSRTLVKRLDPKRLLEQQSDGNLFTSSLEHTAFTPIIVSPDVDLFSINNRSISDYASDIVKLCGFIGNCKFIFWTDYLQNVDHQSWPPSLELATRVKSTFEIEAISELRRQYKQMLPFALWLVPNEPIVKLPSVPFTRLLLGAAGWLHNKADEDIAAMQQLVTMALNTGYPVHLHSSIRNVLTMVGDDMPAR